MYGIIDIGSNTIRLVLYHVEKSGHGYQISRIMNKKYTASLAGYVTKKGKLSSAGIQCASDILCELRAITKSIHLEKVYVFATASFRNVTNTEEVLRRTEAASGFSPINTRKNRPIKSDGFQVSALSGDRTLDTLIKSQVLSQLS
jgi:exopolyphosphatase/guanosine-5'-triphosphate,3'-diphosphate pyrophosphatase